MPMLGMATMAMAWDTDMAWDMVMVDITDHGDMATGDAKRGPLTSQPNLDLIPMLMLMPMLGTVTTVMPGHGDMGIGDARRGQLTKKLLLGPMLTLMPMPMLGMATMAMAWDTDMAWDMVMVDITDHGDMA